MSYCRWSSDRFQCDVYVYADCTGGWTTHVASSRSIEKSPVMPWRTLGVPILGRFRWWLYTKRNDRWSDNRTFTSIGLEHDGESFNDNTPGECAARLEELKAMGYNVPQYVINSLLEEEQEIDDES